MGDTLNLARRYKLSAYDASYLKLAMRMGLPLVTLDADLDRAVGHHDRRLVELAGARQVRAYFPNFVSGLASLVDTDFIMTIPARLGRRLAQLFELVEFELPAVLDPEPYYLLWHKRTDQDPGLIWLRQLIATHCQGIGRTGRDL